MIDGAGASDNNAGATVVCLDVRLQVITGDLQDVLRRAQDGAAQARVGERYVVQHVEDDLLLHAVHLLHLAQDHAALAVDGIVVELCTPRRTRRTQRRV